MYVVTPFPNYLYALDLSKPGAPVKWKFEPKPNAASQGVACCDFVNRGVGVCRRSRVLQHAGRPDGRGRCRRAGASCGASSSATSALGETMTMAPLVVKDKVLVGNSGGEFGVRGWLTALDAATGKLVWRAYSTGPDSEVLIGPEFKPFYAQDRGKDLGVTTWPPGGVEDAVAAPSGAGSRTTPN